MKGVPWTDEQREAARERIRNRQREAQDDAALAGGEEPAPSPEPVDPFDFSPPPLTEYDRFIASLDDETRSLLSEMELRATFDAGQKRVLDEKRTAAQKRVAERAVHHIRAAEGLLPQEAVAAQALKDRLAEMVTYTPTLPESCYMESLGCAALVIDGKVYRDGQQVTTTRAQFMSMREQVWRAQQSELDFEGRSRLHHLRRERFSGMDVTV